MNYRQTLDWMFEKLPMYQNIGQKAYKKDLHNIGVFLKELHQPHKNFKTIHLAGTNGKGSTSSMIASVLQEAGYKVGLYTSPHLKDFRERIKINGKEISEQYVVDFIAKYHLFLNQTQLSFFEMTVGMAFNYFKDCKVDVAVIEVGLGGLLDATNVISPLVSIITNISLDHTNILGNSIKEIAYQKAGIIKKNTPVVVGQYTDETKNVFTQVAHEKNAKIYFASDCIEKPLVSDLKGNYQEYNIKCAMQSIDVLRDFFTISETAEKEGFLNVVKNTNLKGRWQQMSQNPLIIADTAHNKDGLLQTMKQVKALDFKNLFIVFGVLNDKNLEDIVALLPKNAFYFFCAPAVQRAMNVEVLADKMSVFGFKGKVCASVAEAYFEAKQNALVEDMIYIGGSTFVVAEIL